MLFLFVELAVMAIALGCAACSGTDRIACVTTYRGPDYGEPEQPYFATVKCGAGPEVIACRSRYRLPNNDCRPEPAKEPDGLGPNR